MRSIPTRRAPSSARRAWAREERAAACSGAWPRRGGRLRRGVSDMDRTLRTCRSTRNASPWNPNVGGGLVGAAHRRTVPGGGAAAPISCTDAAPTGCSPSQSAAVTVIPGVVFSPSNDGHVRAYAASDGRILWDLDTIRDFETVNRREGAWRVHRRPRCRGHRRDRLRPRPATRATAVFPGTCYSRSRHSSPS